jgi:hypothetical protein
MAKKFTPKKDVLKSKVMQKMNALTPQKVDDLYWDFNTSMGPYGDRGLVTYGKCSQNAIDFYNKWVDESDDLDDIINDIFGEWAMETLSSIEANPEESGYDEDCFDEDGVFIDSSLIDEDGWVYFTIKNIAKVFIHEVMIDLDWDRVWSIAKKRLSRNAGYRFYLPNKVNITHEHLYRQSQVVINDIKWNEPETLYANIKY